MKNRDVKFFIKIYDIENSKSLILKFTKLSFGILLGVISSFILSIIFAITFSLKFAFLYIENITLKRQNQNLKRYISQIEEEMKITKSKLDSLFDITNNFRILAGLSPLSNDIRNFGIGGYIKKDSISGLSFELNNLKKILDFELQDVKKVKEIIEKRNEEIKRIPSISPTVGIIVSNFGYRNDPFTGEYKIHEGIDISAPLGTPVYASADGIVIFAGYKEGYGLEVEISHQNGIITRYAHLSRILVSPGQKIKRGEIIGKVGSTGRSTGSHLHYEVIVNGRAVNPLNYIILSDVVYD
jgi:murein DD-endopeptidase MepM/ murein hydrolase activator NlpD